MGGGGAGGGCVGAPTPPPPPPPLPHPSPHTVRVTCRIDDIDKSTDTAQSKMDNALKSIEKLLKTKDRCQLCTIFALVVIFVIVTAVALT